MDSDSFQLVFHIITVNLHYSVSSQNRLSMIVGYRKFSDTEVKVYAVEGYYTNFEDIVTLNHFKNTQTNVFYQNYTSYSNPQAISSGMILTL